jgi:hypothetical protein
MKIKWILTIKDENGRKYKPDDLNTAGFQKLIEELSQGRAYGELDNPLSGIS